MNNEPNEDMKSVSETEETVKTETPSVSPNSDDGMTTAVVNPNFMEEVETPAPEAKAEPIAPAPVMEPPIVPEPPKEEPVPEPKKKKGMPKALLIVIIVLVIAVLGVGGYCAYLFFGVSPRSAHDKIIDDFFADANEFAEKLMVSNNTDAKTIKLLADLSFDTNIDELSMLKDYSFTIDAQENFDENYVNYKLTALEKNKSLLEASAYLLNDKLYLDSKDLYDQVIEIGDAEIDIDISEVNELLSLIDSENATHLLDTLKKGIKDSFDKDKFNRNLETATINGKSVKAFNNSYVIEEADFYSMMKTILTTFKNDEKSLQIITDFINEIQSSSLVSSMSSVDTMGSTAAKEITVDDVKELLDSLIDEFKDPELSGSSTKIHFNVYTNIITNQVIGVKLIVKDGSESINLLDYYEDGKNSGFTISLDDNDTFKFEVDTKDTKSEYKLTVEGQTLLTGTVISTDTKAEFTITIEGDSSTLGSNLSGITIGMSAENVDDETVKMELKVGVDQGGKTSELTAKLNLKVTYDEELTKPDVSKAISVEEVDAEKLSDNLLNILEKSDLYDILTPYLEDYSYDYDYDYDYDFDEDLEDLEDLEDVEYSEHCDEAINCDCEGTVCNCEYLANGWKNEAIVCPNPNN